MASALAITLALALLPAATSHASLAPEGVLAQVSDSEDAQQRLDGVKGAYADLLAMIGSRVWNETSSEEQSTVNATLDSIGDVIELWVKQDFNTAQDAIVNAVQDLVTRTSVAIDMKKQATEIDNAVMWCREAEKGLLIDTQERLVKVNKIREDKDDVCRRMKETSNFSWELVAAPSGLCDFSDVTTEGVCQPFAVLQSEVMTNNVLVEANQTLYHELQNRCNQLMDELDNIIRETTLNNIPGNTPHSQKRMECDTFSRQANLAMCTFGDRLQEKCQSKADGDALVVKVYHQQEDRIAQWSASQQIKCKLVRFQNGEQLSQLNVSLIPEPLADCAEDVYVNKDGVIKKGCVTDATPVDDLPCELAIDFQRDVGTMDYKLSAIDSQMTANNFACNEESFKFSGFKWATGAEASDYVKSDFSTPIKLSPLGARPFSFCGDAAGAEEPL